MAGSLGGFSADAFRQAISNTMFMGLPEDSNERPTFYFPVTRSYPGGTLLDSEGRPIDPRIQPTVTPSHAPVQVNCAVEFFNDTTNNEDLVGTIWNTRILLTLLDIDYVLVKDAIEVEFKDRRYTIAYLRPPLGLSTVTVYQLECHPRQSEGQL